MRATKSLSGSLVLLTVAGLWSSKAQAQACGTVYSYTPARFTNANVGDVALIGNSGSAAAQTLAPLAAAVNMEYFHASMVYDNQGTVTETFWDGMAPPSSASTGEDRICTKVVSPYFLARLSPGAYQGGLMPDVVPSMLVQGLSNSPCTLPQDNYHINSFLHDDIPGGSCEKALVDYCGLPVNQYNTYLGCWGDGPNRDMPYFIIPDGAVTVEGCTAACGAAGYPYAGVQDGVQCDCGYSYGSYGPSSNCYDPCSSDSSEICGGPWANGIYETNTDRTINTSGFGTAVNSVWWTAYEACEGVIDSSWPWDGIGCGGTPSYIGCERAAWQYVNEIVYKADPLQSGSGWDDGWSDYNPSGDYVSIGQPQMPPADYNEWWGPMMGGAKMNQQANPDGSLCAGSCNDGGCNSPPVWCAPYENSAFTINAPDTIRNAAERLNPGNNEGQPGYQVAGNIQDSYYTSWYLGDCSGECINNQCQYQENS
jgi:hypothetical protein